MSSQKSDTPSKPLPGHQPLDIHHIHIPTNKRKHALYKQDLSVFTFIHTHPDQDGNCGEADKFIANSVMDGDRYKVFRSRHRLLEDGWLIPVRAASNDPITGRTIPMVVKPTASLVEFIDTSWAERRAQAETKFQKPRALRGTVHETVHALSTDNPKPVSCTQAEVGLSLDESKGNKDPQKGSCTEGEKEASTVHAHNNNVDIPNEHKTVGNVVVGNRSYASTPVHSGTVHEIPADPEPSALPAKPESTPTESPLDKARRDLVEYIKADRKSTEAGYPDSWGQTIQQVRREVARLEQEGL